MNSGKLADLTGMSKSGFYAHFRSKEALQLAVLKEAFRRFQHAVVDPALIFPAGLTRLRTLYARHLGWVEGDLHHGGCPFVGFVQEFDQQPGIIRDTLRASQQRWDALLTATAADAIRSGEITGDRDAAQISFELYGAVHAYHVQLRLLEDAQARARAEAAFTQATGVSL